MKTCYRRNSRKNKSDYSVRHNMKMNLYYIPVLCLTILLLVSLITGILCACGSALYMWRLYDSSMGPGGILAWSREQKDFPKENVLEFMTLFSSWMGAEQQSVGSRLFYMITPFLAAMPCGWSFWEELNSGYLHMIVTRKDRKSYFFVKVWISFLTGGMVAWW